MSQMIEVKTADLIGPALDWAVGVIQNGQKPSKGEPSGWKFKWIDAWVWPDPDMDSEHGDIERWSPSTNWSQGGPLISEYVDMVINAQGHYECCVGTTVGAGPTILIAACRAVATIELGEYTVVPAELLTATPRDGGEG